MKYAFQKIMRFVVFGVSIFVFFFVQSSVASASIVCTNLTSDVFYGITDSYTGGPIESLQNFLVADGYLNATPNGHFGPATLAAVTAFQTAYNIPSTGYVGPLTRAAIETASCASTVSTPPSTIVTTSTAPAPSIVPTSSSNVIAPLAGATLLLGKTYTIAWNGVGNTDYSIVLEDQNGLSQGFITPNAQMGGSYNWQVGTVLSGITNTYSVVPTGTYQIDLRSISGGAPDIISGKFTISTPPLAINSIVPLTVSASTSPTMVLYGTGFNSSATVTVDGYYNLTATNLYASPDGTVLVFSLPSAVPVGVHNIYVSDGSGLVSSAAFNVTQ